MVVLCWKSLGSPDLVPSNTLLTAFDGRCFFPHIILSSFDIKLTGKIVSIEFEVVDAHLDYNLLLGRICTNAMCVIPLLLLCFLVFPHEGNIVTINQVAYSWKSCTDTS